MKQIGYMGPKSKKMALQNFTKRDISEDMIKRERGEAVTISR